MFNPDISSNEKHQLQDTRNETLENEIDTNQDEDCVSKLTNDGIEAPSVSDQAPHQHRFDKRKHYHRHSKHHIQEMEAFFKEYPHPNDKQQKELGERLSLEPLQIKYWFQNKRTQRKAKLERNGNLALKTENERLTVENNRCKQTLETATCPHCGGPAAVGEVSLEEQHLRIENVRLRKEIDQISCIAAMSARKSKSNYPHLQAGPSRSLDNDVRSSASHNALHGVLSGAIHLQKSVSGPTECNNPLLIELANSAMEELFHMAQAGDPLWISSNHVHEETLNKDEYVRLFPRDFGRRPMGMKSEASRYSAVVIINHLDLVEILMDVDQWSSVFASLVSRAKTLEVLSTGVARNYNGVLQVMTAEYQASPLVRTRENCFVRYCKQQADGTWAVVDVSNDNLGPGSISRCRLRPSGCLIKELPNGYSKVTWVEHVEFDDSSDNSSLGFDARHWVATLERQCHQLAALMANNLLAQEARVISSSEGRKNLLRLAERMVLRFCSTDSDSTAHTWTLLSGTGADDIRFMARNSMDDPGTPSGVVLSASTSFQLSLPPKRVFDFLRDENSRSKWDILTNGRLVRKMDHIANGRDSGNDVSLLRINNANSGQNMLILQESSTDSMGSLVISAPFDTVAMNAVLSGGDPDIVAFLPTGFAILPDGTGAQTDGASECRHGGTLLTLAFQVLADSNPRARLSVSSIETVSSMVRHTADKIKEAILAEGP